MRGWLLALVLLTLTYVFTLASFKPWDLLTGAVVSGVVLFVFRGFLSGGGATPSRGFLFALLAFFPFAAAVLWEVTKGTWEVTLVTVGIKLLRSPGIVAVPIGERSPVGVAVSTMATTLSPGTFLVDIDRELGVMLLHTIDASDPDAFREEHQRFYERYQKGVFP